MGGDGIASFLDGIESQDADYSYIPSLSDELVLLILARLPPSLHQTLRLINKHYHALSRSRELYNIRQEVGIREPSVFMLVSGEPCWWALDPLLGSHRNLPELPSDHCFASGDKESLCTGTQLLVSGKEIEGLVIWRYELAANRWFRGPSMIKPRCLFASANCGAVACIAGGIVIGQNVEVLDSAEKYDPARRMWEPLPTMNRRRKLCSGCYMDNKFYVIGGVDESNRDLTCGEFYDAERDVWILIPDMMNGAPCSTSRSPPLVAVANNELYSLDATSNQLKVYLKGRNSWRELGNVPVKADHSRGWGVAFKSLGDELLLIGLAKDPSVGHGMMICTCWHDTQTNALHWRKLGSNGNHMSPFVFNCSVMAARS
ncbi:F-box/kelch-repeat-like protein [Cinnamomum micranthum f. kanehirae]|uniref:F-box/kelch-repeat-like protein n=1 Tax=Cinnamomum micranthum f. kanehirae TaxID=337451 RepID=A0A3S3N871_9MAGN|nr:F-box/kelch-repeat-like protein [Cinnamomum micranthum f. kanehirae]